MAYDAVVLSLLLLRDGYAVYLAWYVSELSERTLADYLLVEGGRERNGTVGAAEAVHLGQGHICRQRDMIERLLSYESEKSRGTSACLSNYHVDIILQNLTSAMHFEPIFEAPKNFSINYTTNACKFQEFLI